VSPGNGGLWGEVALEVRRTDFLRDVRLWATFPGEVRLHVAGEAVGTGGRHLELYVLVNGRTVVYRSDLTPQPGGTMFHETVELPGVGRWWPRGEGTAELHAVLVDLIDGGSLCHRLEQALGFRELHTDRGDHVLINGRGVALQAVAGQQGNSLGIYPAGGPIEQAGNVYDYCDREGILLRQALPLAPGDHEETLRQVEALVKRLQGHPSILEWCCAPGEEVRDAALEARVAERVRTLDETRCCAL
jgi:beta-mannosidase